MGTNNERPNTLAMLAEFLKWFVLFAGIWLAAFATLSLFCCLPRRYRRHAPDMAFEAELMVAPEIVLKEIRKNKKRRP